MDNHKLKMINPQKNASKKKNNIALNYDYISIVKKIQDFCISGVINENVRIMNLITAAQNLSPENDVFSVSTSNDASITMSPTSTQY